MRNIFSAGGKTTTGHIATSKTESMTLQKNGTQELQVLTKKAEEYTRFDQKEKCDIYRELKAVSLAIDSLRK